MPGTNRIITVRHIQYVALPHASCTASHQDFSSLLCNASAAPVFPSLLSLYHRRIWKTPSYAVGAETAELEHALGTSLHGSRHFVATEIRPGQHGSWIHPVFGEHVSLDPYSGTHWVGVLAVSWLLKQLSNCQSQFQVHYNAVELVY